MNNSKNNNFFHCLGICMRLFKFVTSLTWRFKRVTATCHCLRQDPTAVPIVTSLARPVPANVELRRAQFPAHETGPVSGEEQERIRERKGKSVAFTRSEEEEEVKLQNYPPPRSRPPLRQRQVRPLFDVAVNINEKSDEFIRSRKEAMRRNYRFDMETC